VSGPMTYVGIDPGASGCIAVQTSLGERRQFKLDKPGADLEAFKWLKEVEDGQDNLIVFLERVGGFVGRAQPGSAMFNFGKGVGRLEGIMEALAIPYRQVVPQVWQKGIPGVAGLDGPDRKRALRAEAVRRFPNIKVTLDNCDALLILDYAKTFSS
jgi:hypothetical protein